MERLSDYIQGERVVREMRLHAPEVLSELVNDFSAPLNKPFEKALARSMDNRFIHGFAPSRVLMPKMMDCFGVEKSHSRDDMVKWPNAMKVRCDNCPVVGHCWRTMRSADDVAKEDCDFCPNAEAFEKMAS